MKSDDELKKHLEHLEVKLLQPATRSSLEELDMLLADDFMEFGQSGRVIYKRDCMVPGGIGGPQMTLHSFELRSLAIDTALVTYRVVKHLESGQSHSLRSSIWKYRDGRWQMYFHQGTSTSEPVFSLEEQA